MYDNWYWVAIRRADGHEWIDLGTLAVLHETAEILAARMDDAAGSIWAQANPVVRYQQVRLQPAE